MRSMSTKTLLKAKNHVSSSKGKYSTKLDTKDNVHTIPLPIVDVDPNRYVEDQLLMKHKSYWLKRKSLFEQYFISSFKPMQCTEENFAQKKLLTHISSIPSKMAPKKKFKTRKDGENPSDFSSCGNNFIQEDKSWFSHARCVKKARAA